MEILQSYAKPLIWLIMDFFFMPIFHSVPERQLTFMQTQRKTEIPDGENIVKF